MSNRFFVSLALLGLCLTFSAPVTAGPLSLRSFDATSARPSEMAREARASAPGTLFRIAGLRGAEGERLTLDLETATLFTPDFHLYVDGHDRGREVVERLTVLRGTVEEWPRSSVSLVVNNVTGAWDGYVVAGDQYFDVSLRAGATEGPIAKSAVISRTAVESPAKSLLSDALEPPGGLSKMLQDKKKAPVVIVPPGVEYNATIAIETDYEMYQIFDDVEEATTYLTSIIAGVSEVYFRQIGVSLSVASLSLYTSPDDPWNAPNPHSGATGDVLCEFSSFWQRNRPAKSFPRNGAVFYTGKLSGDIGGQAWVSSLCAYAARPSSCPFGGYGIVVLAKRRAGDTLITAHELGHVFGSHHTHCYHPPIDECHATESGCYSGPVSTPEGGGSIMSYCAPSNLSLGEAGKFGVDSQRVEDVMKRFVDSVAPSCLTVTGDPFDVTGVGSPGSATLSWVDPFSNETNWLVEQRQSNGKYKQVKSLPANTTSVTITKLKPGDNVFRLRAKVKKNFSIYSALLTVTVP